jgi:hypothetical protein
MPAGQLTEDSINFSNLESSMAPSEAPAARQKQEQKLAELQSAIQAAQKPRE